MISAATLIIAIATMVYAYCVWDRNRMKISLTICETFTGFPLEIVNKSLFPVQIQEIVYASKSFFFNSTRPRLPVKVESMSSVLVLPNRHTGKSFVKGLYYIKTSTGKIFRLKENKTRKLVPFHKPGNIEQKETHTSCVIDSPKKEKMFYPPKGIAAAIFSILSLTAFGIPLDVFSIVIGPVLLGCSTWALYHAAIPAKHWKEVALWYPIFAIIGVIFAVLLYNYFPEIKTVKEWKTEPSIYFLLGLLSSKFGFVSPFANT